MLRSPPKPTLFPYTTLFRSRSQRENCAASNAGRALHARLLRHERLLQERGSYACKADRKSTRLNSSHQIISYAVFCLKKKKIIVQKLRSILSTCLQVSRDAT